MRRRQAGACQAERDEKRPKASSWGGSGSAPACLDKKNNWSIKFSPKDDHIVLSPNYNSPDNAVEQALSYCEDFKEISVLGYHTDGIRIPDSFNVDFLTGFEKLEKFEMRGFYKQEYMDIVKSRMPALDGVEVVISKT